VGRAEYGLNIGADEYQTEGVRFLRTTDIGQRPGDDDVDGVVFVRSDAVPAEMLLRPGDLLFSRSGTLGRCYRHEGDEPTSFAGYLVRFRPLPDTNPRYLAYCAEASFFQDAVRADAITSTISNFNAERYASVRVPLADAANQRAIADYLDQETARIDALITAKRRMVDLLEERRTAELLHELAPHKERRPVGWRGTRLKYLFASVQAGTWGEEASGTDEDMLCVRVADFDRRRLAVSSSAATLRAVEPGAVGKSALEVGDVLIEKSGGGERQPVGFAVSYRLQARAVCSNFIARLRPSSEVDAQFAGLVMAAAYRLGANMPFVKQTTGIQNLDLTGYLGLSWHVPSRDGQIQIVERLMAVFRLIDSGLDLLNAQINLLQERRQALITAAVTGELAIPEVAA
jgi:type I restriction enzyme S subunit